MVYLVVGLIRAYQLCISPFLGSRCRFYPSCSEYSAEVMQRYGLLRGGMRMLRRLLKCHPFHPGGVDLP